MYENRAANEPFFCTVSAQRGIQFLRFFWSFTKKYSARDHYRPRQMRSVWFLECGPAKTQKVRLKKNSLTWWVHSTRPQALRCSCAAPPIPMPNGSSSSQGGLAPGSIVDCSCCSFVWVLTSLKFKTHQNFFQKKILLLPIFAIIILIDCCIHWFKTTCHYVIVSSQFSVV